MKSPLSFTYRTAPCRPLKSLLDNMSWQQVTPGHYKRKVGVIESLMLYLRMISPQHINKIQLSLQIAWKRPPAGDIDEAIRTAWKALRHNCPGIATQIEGDELHYRVPDDVELQKWTEATCHIHESKDVSPEQLLEAYPTKYPAEIHYVHDTSQLLFKIDHTIADGAGTLYLMDRLLHHLTHHSTFTFGDEMSRLTPTVEYAFGIEEVPSADPGSPPPRYGPLRAEFPCLGDVSTPPSAHQHRDSIRFSIEVRRRSVE